MKEPWIDFVIRPTNAPITERQKTGFEYMDVSVKDVESGLVKFQQNAIFEGGQPNTQPIPRIHILMLLRLIFFPYL